MVEGFCKTGIDFVFRFPGSQYSYHAGISRKYSGFDSPKGGSYPLAGKSASDFFTDMGPFTVTPYTPVDANFKFQNYDVTHGEIGPGSAEGITPLLNGPGGGIVLGVDMSRRIIYIGDIDIFSANNSNSGINNSKGTINSNASKLIANLFAWVVGVGQ